MKQHTPLAGWSIVVTRAQDQLGEARQLLQNEGAEVLDLPALVIGPPDQWDQLDEALADLANFHWIIFSSANGVASVEARLQRLGQSLSKRPKGLKIAAVGRKTAKQLESFGATTDFVPPDFVADSLIEDFPVSGYGMRMLMPRVQSGGRTILADAFREAGARIIEVPAYQSSCPESMPSATALAMSQGQVNVMTFCSGKTASHTAKLLLGQFGENWLDYLSPIKLISIGPQTSTSCYKHFGRMDYEANPHDLEGLVKACIEARASSKQFH